MTFPQKSFHKEEQELEITDILVWIEGGVYVGNCFECGDDVEFLYADKSEVSECSNCGAAMGVEMELFEEIK